MNTKSTYNKSKIIKKKKVNTLQAQKIFSPVVDLTERLEAAMGVYQCVFFVFLHVFFDRGGTGR